MDVMYKNFRAGDVLIFDSSKGVFHAINVTIDSKKTKDNYPYIVRTSKNNGIRGYINEDITKLNPANTISFAQDTAQMFYQAEQYFTGNKVKILSIKDYEMDEKIAIFLISCLNKAFSNFAWGSSYDTKILVEVPLGLPIKVDDSGNPIIDKDKKYHKDGYMPDFDYMREKIVELEREKVIELEEYLISTGLNNPRLTDEDIEILSLSGFGNYKELDNKDSVNICKNFKVSDLFIVEGTKSLDAGALTFKNNGVNFVGRTGENNGIQGKIDKQSFEPNEANTITATVIGNYKYVKYQQEPYYCSQNINKLTPKFNINEYLGLWFRSEIQKFVSLYDHQQGGYKLDEIKNFEFHLPIQTDKANNPIIDETCQYHSKGYIPDWDFMEKYIKAIEKIVIADVVKYKDSVIEKTKVVVNQ